MFQASRFLKSLLFGILFLTNFSVLHVAMGQEGNISPRNSAQSRRAVREDLETLVNQKFRPTMTQIVAIGRKAGFNFAIENPLSKSKKVSRFKGVQEAAEVIIQLELMFPGATFAPLGRDAVRMGDIIEAFYLGLNQKNRVKRIELSTSSFKDLKAVKAYLKGLGIVPDPKNIENTPPLVLFDRTSFSPISQSRRVTQMIFQLYKEAGGDPKDLKTKIVFTSTQPQRVVSFTDFLSNPMGFMKRFLKAIYSGRPLPQHTVDIKANLFTDSAPWHGPFDTPKKVKNGNHVRQISDSRITKKQKRQVLSSMLTILKTVQSPAFQRRVFRKSKEYGFEFRKSRSQEVAKALPEVIGPNTIPQYLKFIMNPVHHPELPTAAVLTWFDSKLSETNGDPLTKALLSVITKQYKDKKPSLFNQDPLAQLLSAISDRVTLTHSPELLAFLKIPAVFDALAYPSLLSTDLMDHLPPETKAALANKISQYWKKNDLAIIDQIQNITKRSYDQAQIRQMINTPFFSHNALQMEFLFSKLPGVLLRNPHLAGKVLDGILIPYVSALKLSRLDAAYLTLILFAHPLLQGEDGLELKNELRKQPKLLEWIHENTGSLRTLFRERKQIKIWSNVIEPYIRDFVAPVHLAKKHLVNDGLALSPRGKNKRKIREAIDAYIKALPTKSLPDEVSLIQWISSLYSEQRISRAGTFQIFQDYLPNFAPPKKGSLPLFEAFLRGEPDGNESSIGLSCRGYFL